MSPQPMSTQPISTGLMSTEPMAGASLHAELRLMIVGSYPPPLGGTTVSLMALTRHLQ